MSFLPILPEPVRQTLQETGQAHLVQHLDSLPKELAASFAAELQSIDWRLVQKLIANIDQPAASHNSEIAIQQVAEEAETPAPLVQLTTNETDPSACQQALALGHDCLRAGRVGVIVVAGGQGTRLGTSQPKGLFPVGPISGTSLFEWFFTQVQALREQYGQRIPYAIMTSSATHHETVRYLAEQNYFGLPAEDVPLFQQGNMPAVDAATRRALLAGPGRLAFNPDGHGGMLAALAQAGILQDWTRRGIETLYYHQVDNPGTIVCDPLFLGWHAHHRAEASVKVIAKRTAAEKMGVAVRWRDRLRILEYSDLSPELAAQTDDRGRLKLWAGNTAIHLFQREFLERALQAEDALPFHVAHKLVPFWTAETGPVTPSAPNAYKFERFIFDVLPWAERTLVVEASRAREFAPIKNRDGDDSPATARTVLMALHRDWLRRAGAIVGDEIPVEISPLVAMSAADLHGKVPVGLVISQPLLLDRNQVQQWQAGANTSSE